MDNPQQIYNFVTDGGIIGILIGGFILLYRMFQKNDKKLNEIQTARIKEYDERNDEAKEQYNTQIKELKDEHSNRIEDIKEENKLFMEIMEKNYDNSKLCEKCPIHPKKDS